MMETISESAYEIVFGFRSVFKLDKSERMMREIVIRISETLTTLFPIIYHREVGGASHHIVREHLVLRESEGIKTSLILLLQTGLFSRSRHRSNGNHKRI